MKIFLGIGSPRPRCLQTNNKRYPHNFFHIKVSILYHDDKVVIVMNPSSGGGGGGSATRKIIDMKRCLNEHGIIYDLRCTEYKNHAISLVHDAIINEEFRYIVSIGGDGTLNEVINGIMNACHNNNSKDNNKMISSSDITLAMIPFGTGNDWIRTHYHEKQYHYWKNTISLLKQKEQQLKTVLHDIGVVQYNKKNKKINNNMNDNNEKNNMNDDDVTKKYFINVAGLAYDAYVVKQIEKQRSSSSHNMLLRLLPCTIQYLYMIIYCLFTYQPKKISVIINENDVVVDNEEIYTVHIGICRYSGGGCIMVPHAIYDDGKLSITIIRRVSIWNVITSMSLFYNGQIAKHPKVTLHTTNKSVHVSQTLIEIDGELLCNGNEMNTVFTIIPHAIRVVVP